MIQSVQNNNVTDNFLFFLGLFFFLCVFNAMAWIYKSSLPQYVSVENEKNFDS